MTVLGIMGKGDELIARVIRGDKDAELSANNLLAEFQRGYPIDRLATLLESETEEVVKTGVWIASELGGKAAPHLKRIAALLSHPHPHVRFFAIDSVLTCATVADGKIAADVVLLLGDKDSAVRWKALVFLVQAPQALLNAALACLSQSNDRSAHLVGLRLLASSDSEIRRTAGSYLDSEDDILKRYGTVAAVRVAREDTSLLNRALLSADSELRQFIDDMRQRMQH